MAAGSAPAEGMRKRVGAKKSDSWSVCPVLARRTAMFASVAEENHLKPSMRQGPSGLPSLAVAPSTVLGRASGVKVARVSVF